MRTSPIRAFASGRIRDSRHRKGTGRLRSLAVEMKKTYCVFNKTNESFLGLKVTCASTSLARVKGLVGKLRISPGEGLWMVPSRGIHTVGVLFPVDVIYLDPGNRVVHMVEHMRPFRLGPIRLNAASVLELPVHTIYASQTRVGDQMLICRPEEIEMDLTKDVRAASQSLATTEAARR
jgi:uncharacterized protein